MISPVANGYGPGVPVAAAPAPVKADPVFNVGKGDVTLNPDGKSVTVTVKGDADSEPFQVICILKDLRLSDDTLKQIRKGSSLYIQEKASSYEVDGVTYPGVTREVYAPGLLEAINKGQNALLATSKMKPSNPLVDAAKKMVEFMVTKHYPQAEVEKLKQALKAAQDDGRLPKNVFIIRYHKVASDLSQDKFHVEHKFKDKWNDEDRLMPGDKDTAWANLQHLLPKNPEDPQQIPPEVKSQQTKAAAQEKFLKIKALKILGFTPSPPPPPTPEETAAEKQVSEAHALQVSAYEELYDAKADRAAGKVVEGRGSLDERVIRAEDKKKAADLAMAKAQEQTSVAAAQAKARVEKVAEAKAKESEPLDLGIDNGPGGCGHPFYKPGSNEYLIVMNYSNSDLSIQAYKQRLIAAEKNARDKLAQAAAGAPVVGGAGAAALVASPSPAPAASPAVAPAEVVAGPVILPVVDQSEARRRREAEAAAAPAPVAIAADRVAPLGPSAGGAGGGLWAIGRAVKSVFLAIFKS